MQGKLSAQTALDLAHPDAGPYLVSTKAIAVEDTHNFGGGTVQSIDEISKLYKGAQEMKLPLHMDGARIWNAHVVTGIPLNEYAKYFETMSVCFSKGLGAPVGSMLLSTKLESGASDTGLVCAKLDYWQVRLITRLITILID
jgi:threonine aldolase